MLLSATARGRVAVAVTLLSLASARTLAAQRWQVDATGSRVAFDTITTLNAVSVSPAVEWQSAARFANLGGSIAGFEDGEWAAQARGDLSLLFNPFGAVSRLRLETAGVAAGTYHTSDFGTAAGRAELRLHLASRQVGGWVGGVAAAGWSSGSETATAIGPTAGVWGRAGGTRASLRLTPLRIEGFWFPELDGRASAAFGRFEAAAYGGWRDGNTEAAIDTDWWGGGSLMFWLSPTVAVIAAGGSYPEDLLQALPTGRYVSFGVRVTSRRATVPFVRSIGRPVYERESGSGLLRFRVANATRVEFASDRTQWRRLPMQRAPDGSWILRLRLPPGVHRFNLIVDGTEWIVPEGVPPLADGYGGRVGLLIVPE